MLFTLKSLHKMNLLTLSCSLRIHNRITQPRKILLTGLCVFQFLFGHNCSFTYNTDIWQKKGETDVGKVIKGGNVGHVKDKKQQYPEVTFAFWLIPCFQWRTLIIDYSYRNLGIHFSGIWSFWLNRFKLVKLALLVLNIKFIKWPRPTMQGLSWLKLV